MSSSQLTQDKQSWSRIRKALLLAKSYSTHLSQDKNQEDR